MKWFHLILPSSDLAWQTQNQKNMSWKKNRKKIEQGKTHLFPNTFTQTHTFPRLIDFPLMSCLLTPVSRETLLCLPPHLALITFQISWAGHTQDPLPILRVYRTKVKLMATSACISSFPLLHSSLVLEVCGVGLVTVPTQITHTGVLLVILSLAGLWLMRLISPKVVWCT